MEENYRHIFLSKIPISVNTNSYSNWYIHKGSLAQPYSERMFYELAQLDSNGIRTINQSSRAPRNSFVFVLPSVCLSLSYKCCVRGSSLIISDIAACVMQTTSGPKERQSLNDINRQYQIWSKYISVRTCIRDVQA